MSWNMIHYRRGEKCPICGTNDWCGYVEMSHIKYGESHWLYCHRYDEPKKMAERAGSYYDGEICYLGSSWKGESQYVFCGLTPTGYGKFRDRKSFDEAYERAQRWAEKEQRDRKLGKKPSKKPLSDEERQAIMRSYISAEAGDDESPADNVADAKRLDQVYRQFLSLYGRFESFHCKQLMEKDKWSEEMLKSIVSKYGLVTLPPSDGARYFKEGENYEVYKKRYHSGSRKGIMEQLVEAVGEPEGVPGFYKKKDKDGNEKWTFGGLAGYVIPVNDMFGNIVRLRIRLDDESRMGMARNEIEQALEKGEITESEVEAEISREFKRTGKYHQFSSAGKPSGTPGCSRPGIYGLSSLKEYRDGIRKEVVVCEGEKKAIVASELLGGIVISLPGVSQYRCLEAEDYCDEDTGEIFSIFSWLKEQGVERICVANDSDMKDNNNVLLATIETFKLIAKHGFVPVWAKWSDVLGKGLDDALLNGGRKAIKFERIKV